VKARTGTADPDLSLEKIADGYGIALVDLIDELRS
jgi:hypothetical protein